MTLTLDVGCGSRFQGDVNVDLLVEDSDRHPFDIHAIPNLVVADAKTLPFRDESFSKVTCFHLMEHIVEDHEVYVELNRVANGEIEIRVPLGIWEDMVHLFYFWKHSLKRWRQKHHLRKYTKKNMKATLETIFVKKQIRLVYGYTSFFQVLRFAFLFIFHDAPPATQKLNRKTRLPFPFPFEIVAFITDDDL